MKNSWSLGKKLIVSFLAVAAITLFVGGIGYYGAVKSGEAIDEIGSVRLPSVESVLTINACAEEIGGAMRTLAITGMSTDVRQQQYKDVAAARDKYTAAWELYETLPQTAEEAQVWKELCTAWDTWRAENSKAMEMSRKYDEVGIRNPNAVKTALETARGDHYVLMTKVQQMVLDQELFEGGEDHTACAFGKWVAAFDDDSKTMHQHIQSASDPHTRLHAAVRAAKASVKEGKKG